MKRTAGIVVVGAVVGVLSCGESAPPSDVVLGEGPAAATIARAPFDLTVELADGTAWAGPETDDPALGLLSFGVFAERMNPNRFYDPLDPRVGRWVRPGNVRSTSVTGERAELVADVDPLVGSGVALTVERHCDGPAAAPTRCWTTVQATVTDPGVVAFTRLCWALAPGEALYGLGERFDAPNARGRMHALQMMIADSESNLNEVHVPVPWLVSTRGYAVLIDELRPGAVDVGATSDGIATATFASVGFTFHVVTAGDPWSLAGAIGALTALPRLPPAWAFGPQMWRNVLDDGAELESDAAAIRANDLPVSVLWIDNPWQTAYNDFHFNELQFPGAAAMIGRLHDAGYKVLVWSTPYLDTSDDSGVREGMHPDTGGLYEEAAAQGHLVMNTASLPAQYPWTGDKMGAMIDFTKPAASEWWTETARRATGLGIDGFKLDYGELLVTIAGSRLGLRFADGTSEAEAHNRYSVLYHRAYREALRRDRPDGFIIGRASTIGGQADVDCIWPGDLDPDLSSWGDATPDGPSVGGLSSAVHALQSLAVSGFPTFGADTGGFRGTPTSEQLVRWASHTAFTPVMQIGGGGDSHNPWDTTLFPEPWVLPAMRDLMRLHQQLFPYAYALVCDATFAPGPPPVLPLGLAFPDDPSAAGDDCAYMFGRRMLVAPGCRGEDPRRLHLPAGTWVDWWTGDVRSGPDDIDVADPPGAIPVFLAAGAIVPLLSADVDTMVESTDAATVSAAHRAGPDHVRVVPPATGETAVWQVGGSTPGQCPGYVGALQSLEVSADADCVNLTAAAAVAPALVLELDWQVVSAAAPGRVEGASAFTAAASIEGVLAGCGGCWFHDDATGKVYASPVPLRVCR